MCLFVKPQKWDDLPIWITWITWITCACHMITLCTRWHLCMLVTPVLFALCCHLASAKNTLLESKQPASNYFLHKWLFMKPDKHLTNILRPSVAMYSVHPLGCVAVCENAQCDYWDIRYLPGVKEGRIQKFVEFHWKCTAVWWILTVSLCTDITCSECISSRWLPASANSAWLVDWFPADSNFRRQI